MKPATFHLAAVLSFVLACSCGQTQQEAEELVDVTVQRISYSAQDHPQVYMGRIEAGKTTVLSAPYPGRLVELKVRKGQWVKAGDVIAVVDAPSVKSLYQTAKATFEQAKDGLDRVNQVYSSGGVSELKLVDVQTSYAKAQAALEAATRAVEDCSVKAPYSGVIGDIMVEQGVELTVVQPIVKLLDVSSLEIHASVPENEYSDYNAGKVASVQVDAVDGRYDAVLLNKGFEASPLSHAYDFVFLFKVYAKGVMPGMVCKVYMSGSNVPKSVIIPSSSVRVDAEGRYVWCIAADSSVVKKHIVTGGFSGDGVIVEDGLEEGDLLVVEGGRKISTGMKNIWINECQ